MSDSPDPFLAEADAGADPRHPLRRWLSQTRERIAERAPWAIALYRILVAVLGTTIIVVGAILIPLPGPGWLIVFLGLAVLGTEFRGARRVTRFLRAQLRRFWIHWRAFRVRRSAAQA